MGAQYHLPFATASTGIMYSFFCEKRIDRRANEWKQLKRDGGGGEEVVNGLGIKDERGELKAALFVFSFTFLSFLWTSFLNKLRLEKGRTNYSTTTACRDFR